MIAYCLVVPCFNETQRLPQAEFRAYLAEHPEVAMLFVDDGSTDGTGQLLTALAASIGPQAGAHLLPKNGGKAEAVRQGMLAARSHFPQATWLGFWDADLSVPLQELDHFRWHMARFPDARFMMASRFHRLGARLERHLGRHILSRTFATLTSQLLKLPVYDSQCGAKLLHRDYLPALFTDPFVTRWLFDVELLARLLNAHGRAHVRTHCYEVPILRLDHVGNSRLKPTDMLAAPLQLLKIRRRYRPGRK